MQPFHRRHVHVTRPRQGDLPIPRSPQHPPLPRRSPARIARALRILGISLTVLVLVERIVFTTLFVEPFGNGAGTEAVGSWLLAFLLGAGPFLVLLIVLAIARPAGLIWWAAVVFTVLAGAFGIVADVDMLTLDDPLAGVGLFVLAVVLWAALVVVGLVVGVVAMLLHRRRGRAPGPADRALGPDDRATRPTPTGNSFDTE